MFLKRLTIENFGPFQGVHTLDLSLSCAEGHQRPVTLIGGHNGSGKTSLLEAIRLCLHGRRALGNPRTVDYHNHLINRIHHGPGNERANRASVKLEVSVVQNGREHQYEVVRSWLNNSNHPKEDLRIICDDEILQEFYVDQYQGFLDELVPLGLAELFFFDGERIQKLAEDDGSDSVVADSIRSLLGLDMVSRLHADMAMFVRTRGGARPTTEAERELETSRSQLESYLGQIESLNSELSEVERRLNGLDREVALQEGKISSEGGDFARNKENLVKEQSKWHAKLESSETELRELATGLLPFCVAPELSENLNHRLKEEAKTRNQDAAASILQSTQRQILDALGSPTFWTESVTTELSQPGREQITKAFTELVDDIVLESTSSSELPPVHDLSDGDRQLLLDSIHQVLTDLPYRAKRIAAEAEEAHQRLSRVERDLQRAPTEAVLQPLFAELGKLHSEVSDVQHEKKELEAALHHAGVQKVELERTLSKVADRLEDHENHGRVITLANKVMSALSTYDQELTVARVQRLGECVTDCYNQLAHKQSLCKEVRFDQDTLAVKLYNSHGNLVYRPLLSAGEKQVLAIAILWGLGRSSGRELPVIIDTPLARLDVEHRHRLVSHYFPNASHQIILLATDSEINQPQLNVLKPWIANSYHLQFDVETNQTRLEDGYLPLAEVTIEH